MRHALIAFLAIVLAGCSASAQETPRNVVLVIADGGGPAYYTMVRDFNRAVEGREGLVFDGLLTGSVQTRAANSRVTDSASSATAYASGVKTNNGMIGMTPDTLAVGTLIEAAEAAGWNTGLVSTARITHATPAAFSAHVPNRAMEAAIAQQLIGQGIEVVAGGGSMHFLPVADGGARADSLNIMNEAARTGYFVTQDGAAFMSADSLPVMGLFTPSHLRYEIDRTSADHPSIAELASKTLELLSGQTEPFFVMIETGRVDHAGHGNDPAGVIREMQAYEDLMTVLRDFADRDGQTLVVATADHETGGLGLGMSRPGGGYTFLPERLADVSISKEAFEQNLMAEATGGASETALLAYVMDRLAGEFGNPERMDGHEDELAAAVTRLAQTRQFAEVRDVSNVVMKIVSMDAAVQWASYGHTAVDVPLYAVGPAAERFAASIDNTEIGLRLAELMGVDLDAVTDRLRAK